jgi:hypothetical protein
MNVTPALEQHGLLLRDNPFGPPRITARKALLHHHLGQSVCADQVEFGMAIAKHMDMGRFMILREEHDVQPRFAMYRYHDWPLTDMDGLFKSESGEFLMRFGGFGWDNPEGARGLWLGLLHVAP